VTRVGVGVVALLALMLSACGGSDASDVVSVQVSPPPSSATAGGVPPPRPEDPVATLTLEGERRTSQSPSDSIDSPDPASPSPSSEDESRAGSNSKSKKSKAETAASTCDPNYTGACVPISAFDLDCPDISQMVRVVGADIHGFDRDGDGFGCESYG
jgi:hypothetical protein